MATKPPMLEPRTQTRAGVDPSRPARNRAIRPTSASACRRHLVRGRRRGRAGRRRAPPSPRAAQARPKSAWFSFREPAPWTITIPGHGGGAAGSQSRYGRPGARRRCSLGGTQRPAQCCRHRPAIHDAAGPVRRRERNRPSEARPSTRLGSRVNERGHLEVGGCDVVELAARVRHPRLRLRRGRHPRPGPRVPRGVPARGPTTSRSIYASKAAPITAVCRWSARGGALDRRRLGRRAPHRAAGRVRARAHPHARQQQDRGRAAARGRGRGRPRDLRLAAPRSTASTRSAPRPGAGSRS